MLSEQREQEKFSKHLSGYQVQFEPMVVSEDGVFWAGTVNGTYQWVMTITPDESTSGIRTRSNPRTDQDSKIDDLISGYYTSFYTNSMKA